jgi:hypothetical protein
LLLFITVSFSALSAETRSETFNLTTFEELHELNKVLDAEFLEAGYFCTATISYRGRVVAVGSGIGATIRSACDEAYAAAIRNMK